MHKTFTVQLCHICSRIIWGISYLTFLSGKSKIIADWTMKDLWMEKRLLKVCYLLINVKVCRSHYCYCYIVSSYFHCTTLDVLGKLLEDYLFIDWMWVSIRRWSTIIEIYDHYFGRTQNQICTYIYDNVWYYYHHIRCCESDNPTILEQTQRWTQQSQQESNLEPETGWAWSKKSPIFWIRMNFENSKVLN